MATTVTQGFDPDQLGPDALASILANGSLGSSLSAAWALGDQGTNILDPLVEVLQNPDRNIRWSAAIALQRIGASAVDPLTKVLVHGAPEARGPAIWALEKIGDARAVDPLIDVLRCDNNEFCRWMAAAALRSIGHAAGIEAVKEALNAAGPDEIGYIEELVEGS
jgi:HEAT repeat protein